MGGQRGPVHERLWRRVTKTDGCWLWTGNTIGGGYGAMHISGPRGKSSAYVHRLAYELLVGPIPDGLLVLHKCDVRNCVNPDHLFLGTDKDNSDDMMAKRRNRQPKGEKNVGAKLTEGDVVAIRASNARQVDMARAYGISRDQVRNIRRRVHWKYVA